VLHLNPKEHERLRKVSYEKQRERGMAHPGRSWLASDILGDAYIWQPRERHASSDGKENLEAEQPPIIGE
jgi:hypothetical protein